MATANPPIKTLDSDLNSCVPEQCNSRLLVYVLPLTGSSSYRIKLLFNFKTSS